MVHSDRLVGRVRSRTNLEHTCAMSFGCPRIVSGEDSCDNSRARARLTRLCASVSSCTDICSPDRLPVDQIGCHHSLYSSKRSALSCTMELSVLYLIRPGLSLSYYPFNIRCNQILEHFPRCHFSFSRALSSFHRCPSLAPRSLGS